MNAWHIQQPLAYQISNLYDRRDETSADGVHYRTLLRLFVYGMKAGSMMASSAYSSLFPHLGTSKRVFSACVTLNFPQ